MRATISFQAEVDQVSDVMLALAKQETDNIRSSAHILETAQAHEVHGKINVALEGLYKNINQLEQYRDMLLGFEKAKFETRLPQTAETPMAMNSASDVRQVTQNMQRFDSFLGRINEESIDDVAAQEG